jgi:hypothetical protein
MVAWPDPLELADNLPPHIVSFPTPEIHAEVGLFRPEDPCLHEQAVRPRELLNTPMERGEAFSMTYIKSPELVIYLEEYGSTMRLRGLAPPGMLVVSVPVTLMPDTLFWRSSLNQACLYCMLPCEIDAHCVKGQRHIILLIDLNLLPYTWLRRSSRLCASGRKAAFCPPIPRGSAPWVTG